MRNIDTIRGLKDLFVSAVNGGTTTVEEFMPRSPGVLSRPPNRPSRPKNIRCAPR